MIIPVKHNNLYDFDGINMRVSVLKQEMNIVMNSDPKKLDKFRSKINSQTLSTFKKVVESQTKTDKLIDKLARAQKKFDVLSGFGVTQQGIYNYMLDTDISSADFGLNQVDFAAVTKRARDMPNLYRTFVQFAGQLFDTEVADLSQQINTDTTLTDSEGKQLNIASSMAVEEEDTDISDQTLKLNYRIYLSFLYNATCSIKGVRNEKAVLDNVLYLLTALWIRDSIRAIEEETGSVSNKLKTVKYQGLDSSKEAISIALNLTPATMILPLKTKVYDEDGNRYTIKSSINGMIRIGEDSSITLDEKTIGFIQTACERSFVQHRGEMELINDKISEDPFVFARYMFRIFKILGIKIVDKDFPDGMSREDVYSRITDTTNPNALCNLIPSYKFSPSFFNKTKTLEEWFNLTLEDFSEDYEIQKYTGFTEVQNCKISAPTLSVLNSVTSGHYPLSAQSKVGVNLDPVMEVNQILQLKHINKLCGTGNTTSDWYKDLVESKLDRVILFEPAVTYSATSGSKIASGISSQIKAEVERPGNAKYYKVQGLHSNEALYDKIVTYKPQANPVDTDERTKNFIDLLIDRQIEDTIDDYMKLYHEKRWYFPFMESREHLRSLISGTKRGDTGYMFLLGDCIFIRVFKETYSGSSGFRPVDCAITCDYKLVYENKLYTPRLYVDKQVVSDEEYIYMGYKNGQPNGKGGWIVDVTKVCISDFYE